MHARGGLPGLEAHPGHGATRGAGGMQRHGTLVAGQRVAGGIGGFETHLQALHRGINKAHCAADRALFAHHVPGFECLTQFEPDPIHFDFPAKGEAEFELGGEPFGLEVETMLAQVLQHTEEILPDETAKHETIMQGGAPAGEVTRKRLVPIAGNQGPDQQLLGERHARIGRHFETAELHQPKPPGRAIGGIELVDANFGPVGIAGDIDQQIAEQAVGQPGQRRGAFVWRRYLRHGSFELIETVVAGLIQARGLAGRADKHAGEKVAHRGVALPVQHQRFEQVRPAQEGAVMGCSPADDDMIAATSADMLAIDHELVGAEAALACLLIDGFGRGHAVVPA